MAIVYQTDKRSGITYAYESISYWDKDKRQSRSKRTLIGPVDSKNRKNVRQTAEDGKNKEAHTVAKRGPVPICANVTLFYGATYLLDQIGANTGVTEDLKACFPDKYRQILSIAYYLVLEDSAPLYRFEKWSHLHKHPYGQNITSQRSSDLFASITEDAKYKFFQLQGKRRTERNFWAYDITTYPASPNF
ncbi:hypothetical protein [Lentibacillus sp. CBA3610]|uniref:hypothetical protein n=1 Tax=Lentibacillus sp. CBA3610 TaxID=2518176 RepID=UPI00159AA6F2|nr:hypothetical protein [Lentibacillus sp. CBA3610]QKY69945.1 hypothetical protein Len3610_10395 [Lentibacillus sp. CBA3610]